MSTLFTNSLSEEIWASTYKYREDQTVIDTFERVAKAVASVEATESLRALWENKFFDTLMNFRTTPGGRIYANAGTDYEGATILNCFVGPMPEKNLDSIDGIVQVLRDQMMTLKSEGGWGMNFSFIRPRGSHIHSIGIDTPGSVKFMEAFNKASEIITEGSGLESKKNPKSKGKIRKGAMMAVLDVTHPDIIEFIHAKQSSQTDLKLFNMSVNCTEEFMERVELLTNPEFTLTDEARAKLDVWNLKFPDTTFEKYDDEWQGDLRDWEAKGYPVVVYDTVSVLDLWNMIMEATYKRAEPGVLFLDRSNEKNPSGYSERIIATNPCITGDAVVPTNLGDMTLEEVVSLVNSGKDVSVASYNTTKNEVEFKKVTWGDMTRKHADVYAAMFCEKHGTHLYEVVMTLDHKVYIEGKGYIELKDIEFDDVALLLVDGEIVKGEYKVYNQCENEDVYDITVEDNHNFFANGILVHNCGEQQLPKDGACNLGSQNLTQFVKISESGDRYFDFDEFAEHTKIAVRFLDNVNDLAHLPLPEYAEYVKSHRRIGLGVTGWGSALYMLGIKFGSPEALELQQNIMKLRNHAAVEASIQLAKEKGMFPACQPKLHAHGEFFKQMGLDQHLVEEIETHGIRNAALFSCQPTGNTGIFANILSGGIEPVFAKRIVRSMTVINAPLDVLSKLPDGLEPNEYFKEYSEGDEKMLRYVHTDGTVYKKDATRGLIKEVVCEDYGIWWLKENGIFDENADYLVTTSDLTVEDHINDLQGWATYQDSAISKTVNLPNDYPFDDFKSLYLDAYRTGTIKGLTTYREGTMTAVLSKVTDDTSDEEVILDDVKLPSESNAKMTTLKAEGRKWYLTTVYMEDVARPFAFFVQTNHSEKTVTTSDAIDRLVDLAYRKGIPEHHITGMMKKLENDSNTDKLTRVISLLLRHGVLIKSIVAVLERVENVYVGSFLFQIKKHLSQYIRDGEEIKGEVCQNCGSSNLVYSEGCVRCNSCFASRC